MKPRGIPPLTDEQWEAVEKEANRKPNKKDLERAKRVAELFRDCPL